MNARIWKEFSEFVFSGNEILCLERALSTLLTKYKDDSIVSQNEFEKNFKPVIDKCLAKLKLHENYQRNTVLYRIDIPEYSDAELFEDKDEGIAG